MGGPEKDVELTHLSSSDAQDGGLHRLDPHFLNRFSFSPRHSCDSPPSLLLKLYLSLSSVLLLPPPLFMCFRRCLLCCLTSALITAPGRPPSTSRLTCESTRPRGVITLKSSKSGHVKLREVFQEPTQVSEGVNSKLLEARFACQNTLDDSDCITSGTETRFSKVSHGLCVRCCRFDLFAWSQVWTRVRTPVGTQTLANQNFGLNCNKQVLLG